MKNIQVCLKLLRLFYPYKPVKPVKCISTNPAEPRAVVSRW